MSIDRLHLDSLISPQLRGPAGTRRESVADDFAARLKSAERETPSVDELRTGAEALLKLAQLHLFQSLFEADMEKAQAGELFAPQHWQQRLQAPSVASHQQVEKLYARMQQQQPAVPQRQEIESMIDQVAEHLSLAPELIHSVVAAESDYQSQAVSAAGAQGLMQLMPETARELGVEDSFEPRQNLMAGSRYLKQLLEKYDGDLDKALAAYNWGQGNVDRKGLEQMPRETREYLAKVKGGLKNQTGA